MSKRQRCRACGCSDTNACQGGCYWIEEDLCSACVEKGIPVSEDTLVGAVIDAARISVMTALHLHTKAHPIVGAEEDELALHLEEAQNWLAGARALTMENAPAPTSIHVVKAG